MEDLQFQMPTPGEPQRERSSGTTLQQTSPSYAQAARRGFLRRHVDNRGLIVTGPALQVLQRIGGKLGQGSLFVLCGPRGTGKTQIATTLACEELDWMIPDWKRWPESKWPMYATAGEVFREIRATYGESECSEVEVLRKFSAARLLIIDETQVRGNTEWEDRTLTDIIDRRYGMALDTILISNLARAALPAALGPSIISRLHETGEVIECNWPSFREKQP